MYLESTPSTTTSLSTPPLNIKQYIHTHTLHSCKKVEVNESLLIIINKGIKVSLKH